MRDDTVRRVTGLSVKEPDQQNTGYLECLRRMPLQLPVMPRSQIAHDMGWFMDVGSGREVDIIAGVTGTLAPATAATLV